jgi:hypothetical protein
MPKSAGRRTELSTSRRGTAPKMAPKSCALRPLIDNLVPPVPTIEVVFVPFPSHVAHWQCGVHVVARRERDGQASVAESTERA